MPEQTDVVPSGPPPQAPSAGAPDPGIRTPEPAEREQATLFRGANVIDVRSGTIRPEIDVLVVGGRIERVGPGETPAGARVVDLAGAYLLPGLISIHVHPGMMVGLRMGCGRRTGCDPTGMSMRRLARRFPGTGPTAC